MSERQEDAASDLLEQYLAARDEPCPLCGYNLRDLKGGRCPECGDALRLHVGLVEPKKAAFLTGLIGLAAGGGFSVLLLFYATWAILVMRGGPELGDIAVLFFETLWTGGLIVVWVRKASALRRMQVHNRWILAILCCLVPLLNFGVFFAIVE
jgi:hypothetical protein